MQFCPDRTKIEDYDEDYDQDYDEDYDEDYEKRFEDYEKTKIEDYDQDYDQDYDRGLRSFFVVLDFFRGQRLNFGIVVLDFS